VLCSLTGYTLLTHRPRRAPGQLRRPASHYVTTAVFALCFALGHAVRGALSMLEAFDDLQGLSSPGVNIAFLTLGALVMPALTMGAVLMIHDAMVQRLEAIANTDGLTGVLSRLAFEEEARRELTRAARGGPPPSLLILDLDHFKAINDTHGHAGGDAVLQAFARAASGQLRLHDRFGRLGGEEFAVLLPVTPAPQAMLVAERIRASSSHASTPIGYTLSAGVATWRHGESLEALSARADQALYQAKQEGRNRVIAEEALTREASVA
jgi:diguanylate cyclase (GGDEF)-like protein